MPEQVTKSQLIAKAIMAECAIDGDIGDLFATCILDGLDDGYIKVAKDIKDKMGEATPYFVNMIVFMDGWKVDRKNIAELAVASVIATIREVTG